MKKIIEESNMKIEPRAEHMNNGESWTSGS